MDGVVGGGCPSLNIFPKPRGNFRQINSKFAKLTALHGVCIFFWPVLSSAQSKSLFSPGYQRHEPEKTVLYKVVADNWNTFLADAERDPAGHGLPKYIKKEFEAFLKCGILQYGFLRVHCESCKEERLVAFSCKKRGFSPSCGGRRMSETAARLVDYVFPRVPIRQWVLSLPIPMRYWLSKRYGF